ncbi:hypothetical protein FDECE_7705 [Fusarium decemcellulare]|nr:hypothetical protein FDECE_7705 [Fusarium decemcellulare]
MPLVSQNAGMTCFGSLPTIVFIGVAIFVLYHIRRSKTTRSKQTTVWESKPKIPNGKQDYSAVFPPSQRLALTSINSRFSIRSKKLIMSLLSAFQKMETDYWIELDNTYHKYIQERKSIHAEHGKDILNALPGSELACKELTEMVIQFLCARYPNHFQLRGHILFNHILCTSYDLSTTEPLNVLLENVPEDFAIMLRDPRDGRYYFRAGVICASTGWSLGTKLGLGLPEIHGPVPDYKEKMQLSMDRFFTKMATSKPIQRGAWGFEVGQHLYAPLGHPSLSVRNKQDPSLSVEDLYFRVDWQTLRRLPLSGAIVFNFKAFFTPVSTLKGEPYIPSLSLKVLNDSKENLIDYKSVWHMEHILKPALAEYERYQVENGIIEKDWEPHTLEEAPFFPGWEEKWDRLKKLEVGGT